MIAEDPISESTKSQISNNKQITMTKIPNPKLVSSGTRALNSSFGHWMLEFGVYLELGAWNLGFLSLMNNVCSDSCTSFPGHHTDDG